MLNQTMTRLFRHVRFSAAICLLLPGALNTETAFTLRAQTPQQSPTSSDRGAPKEGIKVHGYWTIDVRNPDGTLVTHREFENALTGDGSSALAFLLGRQLTVGTWRITLGHSTTISGSPQLDALSPWGGAPFFGAIAEPSFAQPSGPILSKNLTVNVPINKLVLSGSLTAKTDGSINVVMTELSNCSETVPASSCTPPQNQHSPLIFTSKYPLDNPVSGIVAGQIIQVTVAISFS